MSLIKRFLGIAVSACLLVTTVNVEAKPLSFRVLKYVNDHVPKKPGHYQFFSKGKGTYVGQTSDLNRRIKEHLRLGKLNIRQLSRMRWTNAPKHLGMRRAMETSKIRIGDILSKGKMANVQKAPLSRSARKRNK